MRPATRSLRQLPSLLNPAFSAHTLACMSPAQIVASYTFPAEPPPHRCVATLQTCIGERMRLAGVVMQVDWQAVLQGSQMMQQPKEFARIAEESVAQKMGSVRQEAMQRSWLSNDLPSGMLWCYY